MNEMDPLEGTQRTQFWALWWAKLIILTACLVVLFIICVTVQMEGSGKKDNIPPGFPYCGSYAGTMQTWGNLGIGATSIITAYLIFAGAGSAAQARGNRVRLMV